MVLTSSWTAMLPPNRRRSWTRPNANSSKPSWPRCATGSKTTSASNSPSGGSTRAGGGGRRVARRGASGRPVRLLLLAAQGLRSLPQYGDSVPDLLLRARGGRPARRPRPPVRHSDRGRTPAGLARDDDHPPLAEEIAERCRAIHDRLPADWADRARAEITTAGYRPIHKHGVGINIAPLADADIVPKTVDDDVL
jgi:hypothetical protein